MVVEQFKVGGDRNFAYLVADEISREAVVVDPSFSPEEIVEYAVKNKFEIKYIFNTHKHSDHTNGNEEIFTLTNIEPISYGEIEKSTNKKIQDGTLLPLGEGFVKIIYTPGHTNDSICILIDDNLFTGDTLFVGKVGGTDFGPQAHKEYDSILKKLMTLPDDTKIYPGHDYGNMPSSTIEYEKENNPFIKQPNFNAFLDLKINWADYKIKNNIK